MYAGGLIKAELKIKIVLDVCVGIFTALLKGTVC